MIGGNINYYIINNVYSNFNINLIKINIYWILGIIAFTETYLYMKNINKNKIYNIKYYSFSWIYIFLIITIFGTILLYRDIGFIPIIKNTRIYSVSSPLFIRLWSFAPLASTLSISYYSISKKRFYLFLTILLIFISSILNQRMMFILSILTCGIAYIINKRRSKILFIILAIIIIIFSSIFVLNRDYKYNKTNEIIFGGSNLNNIQRSLIYPFFIDWVQLGILLDSNYTEYAYGGTLLNIPISFIPANILSLFGVDKGKIRSYNSAIIFANYQKSQSSVGLRTGIMGEGYINFGLLGFLIMILIGLFVATLRLPRINQNNIDIIGYIDIILYCLTIYALIGQIDAISSLIIYYWLIKIALIFIASIKI